MPGPQRDAVFTIFNPEIIHEQCQDPTIGWSGLDLSRVKYLSYQMEVCPRTQRYHLQGYIQFTSPVRFAGAKKIMACPDVHLVARGGTFDEAIIYTQKDETCIPGTRVEYGTRPLGKGISSDLSEAVSFLQQGGSIRACANEWPLVYVRSHRGLNALLEHISPAAPRSSIRVYVLYGPTGCGKSRAALRIFPEAYWWPRPQNSGCYAAGYSGQQVCIFDDFLAWVPFHLLLRICDRYPLSVNTQGSSCAFRATTIVFTTNISPSSWYNADKNHWPALERRIHRVVTENFDSLDLSAIESLPEYPY